MDNTVIYPVCSPLLPVPSACVRASRPAPDARRAGRGRRTRISKSGRMQTSPPIKAATRPLRSPPKAAKALREPLLARGDQEAGAASGAQPPQPSDDTAYTAHLKAAMYGVINAVVCAPVMIGFAAIIFRHPAFHADPAVYPVGQQIESARSRGVRRC